jgi:hypothetical protein
MQVESALATLARPPEALPRITRSRAGGAPSSAVEWPEVDGLGCDVTHAVPFSGSDPERVALRPELPKAVTPLRQLPTSAPPDQL